MREDTSDKTKEVTALALAALAEEAAQPGQRPGVDDVVRAQPAPLGGAYAVADQPEVVGGVRIAVDGELHAVPPGPRDVLVGEVQPVREGVDLQCRAGAGRRGEHLV